MVFNEQEWKEKMEGFHFPDYEALRSFSDVVEQFLNSPTSFACQAVLKSSRKCIKYYLEERSKEIEQEEKIKEAMYTYDPVVYRIKDTFHPGLDKGKPERWVYSDETCFGNTMAKRIRGFFGWIDQHGGASVQAEVCSEKVIKARENKTEEEEKK